MFKIFCALDNISINDYLITYLISTTHNNGFKIIGEWLLLNEAKQFLLIELWIFEIHYYK